MSAYDDLVERCYQKMSAAYYGDVQEILAEVLRTLEEETDKLESWDQQGITRSVIHAVLYPSRDGTPP